MRLTRHILKYLYIYYLPSGLFVVVSWVSCLAYFVSWVSFFVYFFCLRGIISWHILSHVSVSWYILSHWSVNWHIFVSCVSFLGILCLMGQFLGIYHCLMGQFLGIFLSHVSLSWHILSRGPFSWHISLSHGSVSWNILVSCVSFLGIFCLVGQFLGISFCFRGIIS